MADPRPDELGDPSRILPKSILDTDLYKFTMQQAVLQHFPDAQCSYQFTHRDKHVFFTRRSINQFRDAVSRFSEITLTDAELAWLPHACPYFKPDYLSYLHAYRFKPSQVHIRFVPRWQYESDSASLPPSPTPEEPNGDPNEQGRVEIEAVGPWVEAILWEVPLMATLSEIYFRTVDTDWTHDGQDDIAYAKAKAMLGAGCVFSEFGTRRRRSFHVQDVVVAALIRADRELHAPGRLSGTSNVYLAMKYGIKAVGTIAHEWFMGIAAMRGYEHANGIAMDLWEATYKNVLLLALTDTFSTQAFWKDFTADPDRARRWQGLRQDSGDPYVFAPEARDVYESMGIDHTKKTIIYSDALNQDKVLGLQKQCEGLGFKPSFGIGTFLTNDFRSVSSGLTQKSRALNMVIKLASINDMPCIKISDDLKKNTGDIATVHRVKDIFHLPK